MCQAFHYCNLWRGGQEWTQGRKHSQHGIAGWWKRFRKILSLAMPANSVCDQSVLIWAANIHHLMCKASASLSRKLSHHVMPQALVLKAPGRHVMWYFLEFFGVVPKKIKSSDRCFSCWWFVFEVAVINSRQRQREYFGWQAKPYHFWGRLKGFLGFS